MIWHSLSGGKNTGNKIKTSRIWRFSDTTERSQMQLGMVPSTSSGSKMILRIELTPEEEARLSAAAENEQLEPEAFIRQWVNRLPGEPRLLGETPTPGFDTLLAQYHSLLDKKFSDGLTDDEAENLVCLADEISALQMADPVTQSAETVTQADHARKVAALDQVIHLLRSAKSLP